jgi:predicted nucleic-acid-binding protein
MIGLDTTVLLRCPRLPKDEIVEILATVLTLDKAIVTDRDILLDALSSFEKFPGDFADHLIGEINRRNGCTTTMTFDRAAAKSPYFTELRS